jgi:hypothetical protein
MPRSAACSCRSISAPRTACVGGGDVGGGTAVSGAAALPCGRLCGRIGERGPMCVVCSWSWGSGHWSWYEAAPQPRRPGAGKVLSPAPHHALHGAVHGRVLLLLHVGLHCGWQAARHHQGSAGIGRQDGLLCDRVPHALAALPPASVGRPRQLQAGWGAAGQPAGRSCRWAHSPPVSNLEAGAFYIG